MQQREIRGRRSEHATKRARQVRTVRKPRSMRRVRDADAVLQVTGCSLQSEPENVRAHRDTHRLGKRMHETRWRQAGNRGQRFERKIIQRRSWILKMAQDPLNPRMDRNAPPRLDEKFAQPPFGTRFVWRTAQHGPPTADPTRGYTWNLSIDEFGKRRTHRALCADEGNQQGSTSRVDLMTGVGAHPYGA